MRGIVARPALPASVSQHGDRVDYYICKKPTTTKKLTETCSQESLARWEAITKTGIPLDPTDAAHQNVLRFPREKLQFLTTAYERYRR